MPTANDAVVEDVKVEKKEPLQIYSLTNKLSYLLILLCSYL